MLKLNCFLISNSCCVYCPPRAASARGQISNFKFFGLRVSYTNMPRALPLLMFVALLSCVHTTAHGQKAARAGAARERQVAVRFAPVFRQALGDHPRADYLTNFDFDGDWRGDNNWKNTDDPKFHLRAYVYFGSSVF